MNFATDFVVAMVVADNRKSMGLAAALLLSSRSNPTVAPSCTRFKSARSASQSTCALSPVSGTPMCELRHPWLVAPTPLIRVAGHPGISHEGTRRGAGPLRLHDELAKLIATAATRGAWYRHWRLVSVDSSRLDVADERASPPSGAHRSQSRQ